MPAMTLPLHSSAGWRERIAQMLATLPHREGYEYAQVGADIVLIEAATRLVVDVLKDVFN